MPRAKVLDQGKQRRTPTPVVMGSAAREDRWQQVKAAAAELDLTAAEFVRRALDIALDDDVVRARVAGGRRDVDAAPEVAPDGPDDPDAQGWVRPDDPGLVRLREAATVLVGEKVTGLRHPARWPGDTVTVVVAGVREYWRNRDVYVCQGHGGTGSVLVPAEVVEASTRREGGPDGATDQDL